MAKEIYLYSPIYDFVAEALMAQMEEAKGSDIVIRGNTVGGSVFSGWGIIAKMKEMTGKVLMKVDGSVASMGTMILVFADDSEALDVSRIHLHRADMYVNGPEDQKFLDDVNKDLRAKLTMKIDEAKLKELKGITLDDLFDPTKRVDVWLTAKEAKQIKLINRIVKLTPAEITAINNRFQIAAHIPDKPDDDSNKDKSQNNTSMTREELKEKHPKVYAEIFAAGRKLGVKKERIRVQAWIGYSEIDAVAVNKAINDGAELTMKEIAEFSRKGLSPEALKNVEKDNPAAVSTKEVTEKEKTDKEKVVASFEKEVMAELGLKV